MIILCDFCEYSLTQFVCMVLCNSSYVRVSGGPDPTTRKSAHLGIFFAHV